MIRTTTLGSALALVVFAAACATTGEPRAGSDSAIITQEEIAQAHAGNAYDLVQSLRPRWLTVRGQSRLGTDARPDIGADVRVMAEEEIPVYLDGTRLGGVETLRSVSIRDVASVRRLSASLATQRFGTGHPNGAIVLNTK
jgi:hypothetical protein